MWLTGSSAGVVLLRQPRAWAESGGVGNTGLELTSISSGNDALAVEGNVKCNALADDSSAIDPDLAIVIDAWAELPESVRAAFVAMIEAANARKR